MQIYLNTVKFTAILGELNSEKAQVVIEAITEARMISQKVVKG